VLSEGLRRRRAVEAFDPSFFFCCEEVLDAPVRTHGGANESGPGKYSGSWLTAGLGTFGTFAKWSITRHPSPRLHHRDIRRLANEESYPVTAAQLLPIFTEFLPSIY